MKAQAAQGTRCPKEGKPREYITDNAAEEVPDSAYYRRLVADGSLVILADKEIEKPRARSGKAADDLTLKT